MRFTSISLALLVLARSLATGVHAAPAYVGANVYAPALAQRDLLSTLLGTVTSLLDSILGEAPVPLPTNVLQEIEKLENLISVLPTGALPTGALPIGALPVRGHPSSSPSTSLKSSVSSSAAPSTATTPTTTKSHTVPVSTAQTSPSHSGWSSARHPSSPPRAASAPRMRRQSPLNPPSLPLPSTILSTPLSIIMQGPPTPATSHPSSTSSFTTTSSASGSASPTRV